VGEQGESIGAVVGKIDKKTKRMEFSFQDFFYAPKIS
jgi:hypothetical protein